LSESNLFMNNFKNDEKKCDLHENAGLTNQLNKIKLDVEERVRKDLDGLVNQIIKSLVKEGTEQILKESSSLSADDLMFAIKCYKKNYCFNSSLIHPREVKHLLHKLTRGYDDEIYIKKMILALVEFTMITYDGLCSLFHQIKYCEENGIEGDYVEAGTWNGGGIGFMALANQRFSPNRRVIHAFDSFQGIPEPTHRDPKSWFEDDLGLKAEDCKGRLRSVNKVIAPRESLEQLMFKDLNFPVEYLKIYEGWFQDTVPAAAKNIEKIALLRLDGDLYESTRVCLEHLFPRVVHGGFVIIDDWCLSGAREAVEEFLKKNNLRPFIHFVDGTVRYFVKE
jgi:O-methyltransferase